jgi:pimeloyl-ACP methyl ester carboxylesterase
MEDRMKYDMLKNVSKFTMPVLMIVGEHDNNTPVIHQKILFEKIPGKKELHIIKNAPHTFTKISHLKEIKNIFINWIKKL